MSRVSALSVGETDFWAGVCGESGNTPKETEPHLLERTKLCLLDWLGCAIAGMPIAREMTKSIGAGFDTGGEALLLGIAGHVLDYDDTLPEALTHPSAVIWPSLLAVRPNGRELVRGFLCGVSVQSRWGRKYGSAIAENSGHPTASLGTVAATVALAAVMGFDEPRSRQAIRVADALAAGSQSVFGTWGKSFQVGCAARAAVEASRLNLGALSPSDESSPQGDPLLAPGGMIRRLTRDLEPDQALPFASDGDSVHEAHPVLRIVQKFHASCYATHGALDAFQSLGVDPDRISSISVTIGEDFPAVATAPLSTDGLGAKFSMRACLALAACGYDTANPWTFDAGPLGDRRVRDFASRISCTTDRSIPSGGGAVELQLFDGGTVRAYSDPAATERDDEALRVRIEAKFRALADRVIGAETATRITARVLDELVEIEPQQLSQLLQMSRLTQVSTETKE